MYVIHSVYYVVIITNRVSTSCFPLITVSGCFCCYQYSGTPEDCFIGFYAVYTVQYNIIFFLLSFDASFDDVKC